MKALAILPVPIFALLSLVASSACEVTVTQADRADVSRLRGESLEYFRDNRTGLCFAIKNPNLLDQQTIASVPCSPEVLALAGVQ